MTLTGEQITKLIEEDSSNAELVAKVLNDSEAAKQLLRKAGFGVTGMGVLATVRETLEAL